MRNKRLLFYFNQIFVVRLGEKLFPLYKKEEDNLSLLRAFGALLKNLVVSWVTPLKNNTIRQEKYKHVFYLETINQRNAIRAFVLRLKKEEVLLSLYEDLNKTPLDFGNERDHQHLPLRRIFFKAILQLPRAFLMSTALRQKYKARINENYILVNLALFLASSNVFATLIKQYKIRSVTVINDHSLYPLAWVWAAKTMGVPSIYIQHATVSDVFPKLIVHTALLEGQQSLDTYTRIGNLSKQHYLVGIIRMDGLIAYKTGSIASHGLIVGLCLKRFYPAALLEALISNLKKSSRVGSVVLRPHPGTSADYLKALETYGLPISNARAESPVDFLKRIDVLVSGESTIILEAALMKIPTLYFDDTVFEFDLYGYVEHGVTRYVKNLTELPEHLASLNREIVEDCFVKSKYYCDTIATDFQNRSGDWLLEFYNHSIDDTAIN